MKVIEQKTWMSLDESVEPVVAGTAVFVGTVMAVVQTKQLSGSVSHVDAAQLETCIFHVLKMNKKYIYRYIIFALFELC